MYNKRFECLRVSSKINVSNTQKECNDDDAGCDDAFDPK